MKLIKIFTLASPMAMAAANNRYDPCEKITEAGEDWVFNNEELVECLTDLSYDSALIQNGKFPKKMTKKMKGLTVKVAGQMIDEVIGFHNASEAIHECYDEVKYNGHTMKAKHENYIDRDGITRENYLANQTVTFQSNKPPKDPRTRSSTIFPPDDHIDSTRQGNWLDYFYEFSPRDGHGIWESQVIIDAVRLANKAYSVGETNPVKNGDTNKYSALSDIQYFTSFPGRAWTDAGSQGFTALLKFNPPSNQIMAVVSFRGSTTGDDWTSDLDAFKIDDIHRGFYSRILKNADTWARQLQNLKAKHNFKDILFTGHSLGGAESSIAPVWLKENAHKYNLNVDSEIQLNTISFASPRPGGDEFKKRFEQAVPYSRRVTNMGDVVTNVPPAKAGFTHVENGLLLMPGYDQEWYMSVCDISDYWGRCGLSWYRYDIAVASSTVRCAVEGKNICHSIGIYEDRIDDIYP